MTWGAPGLAQNYKIAISYENQTENTKGSMKKLKYNNPKEMVRLICAVNLFIRKIRVIRDEL